MEKVVNKDINRRKGMVGTVAKKIAGACKSLWVGEQDSDYVGPVNEEKRCEFEDILNDIKIKEKSYIEAMRADGQLEQVRAREEQSRVNNSRSNIQKDIAD